MNLLDEQAWKREFDRVEARQKQREGWENKRPPIEIISVDQFKKMVRQNNEK